MLRMITRIVMDIKVLHKIQYNKNRFCRSINKNICKSNASRIKQANEYIKTKCLRKNVALSDNSLKPPEGYTGSISFVAYDGKTNTFIGGFLLVPHYSKTDAFYGNTSQPNAEQITYSKKEKDFNKVDSDRIQSLGDIQKNIKKGTEPISPISYHEVKSSTIRLFYGNISQPHRVENQNLEQRDQKNFSKNNKDCTHSLGNTQKNKKDKEPISPVSYNNVKGYTTRLFYGNISQRDGALNHNPKPKKQKDFSKPLKHYNPYFGTLQKSFKKIAKHTLSVTANIVKKPHSFIYFGNILKPSRKVKQGNDDKEYKENDKENVLHDADSNRNNQSFDTEHIPGQSEYAGSSFSEYLTDQMTNIGSILQEINQSISNEEKYKFLLKWKDEINNIYCTIKDLNTATSNVILSQCSTYSESLNNLIASISEDENYAKLFPVLTCITVVSVQLLLLSYLNVPFADQVVNIAISLYHKAHLLKDDPNFQETIDATIKKIEEHLPISLDTLQSIDWVWYFKMTCKASVIFNLVIKSWKESKMEFPDNDE